MELRSSPIYGSAMRLFTETTSDTVLYLVWKTMKMSCVLLLAKRTICICVCLVYRVQRVHHFYWGFHCQVQHWQHHFIQTAATMKTSCSWQNFCYMFWLTECQQVHQKPWSSLFCLLWSSFQCSHKARKCRNVCSAWATSAGRLTSRGSWIH